MYTDPSGYQYVQQEEDTKFKWSFQDEMARTERELGLWNGGNTSIYSYLSAFNKAFQNGYKSDFTQFMRDVDKQASNSDFNGQLTFSYTTQKKSTAKFGKERIGDLEFVFTEFIVYPEVKRSITINLWEKVGKNNPEKGYDKSEPWLSISFNRGILQIETNFMKKDWGAITPGPFIVYPKGGSKNKYYNTHEPGHVIQFIILGPVRYYSLVAIPSVMSSITPYHEDMSWEKSANQLWYWLTGENYYKNPLYFGPNKK